MTDEVLYFVWDDGGREAAGFVGLAGDCVTRAIAIAMERPYREVYDELNLWGSRERRRRKVYGVQERSNARTGVYTATVRRYMKSHGWNWTPTMFIGQGTKVHLRSEELPKGRLVVAVSKHMCSVIDGVIHDTQDPSRDGTRCVYGFFSKEKWALG
jgi:hypothetical protein